MKSNNKDIGFTGEHLAKDFLKNLGYKILDFNYRNYYGEIDLICYKNDILIFTEVKSRYSQKYGKAIESVTYNKVKRIKKIARLYVLQKKLYNYYIRFDVIEIYFNNYDNNHKINHIEDAFR